MLSLIVVNLIFLTLVILFNGFIAEKLLFPNNPEYIVLLGIIVVIDATSALPLAKLRAEENAKKFAFVQLLGIGINIGLNLIFMLIVFQPATQNAEVGVRFILIANLAASLVKPLVLYKDFLQLKWNWDTRLVRSMVKYSFPLALAGFAFIINETVDRILLKHLTFKQATTEMTSEAALTFAESQVGIYSASYKLAMLVTILLQAYRYAAEPFFFAQAKSKDRNNTYVKVMNYFVAAVFVCFLGVALNLDIFKYFIPNSSYWEGLKIVPILLLANVFSGIYINQSIWYKLSGQTKYGAFIATGGAVLTLTLNFIFIPIYGYMACAWATFIVYGGQMIASYWLGQKHYPIPYNLRKFALYSSVAIAVYLLLNWVDISPGITQILLHNFVILLYIGLVYWLEKPSVSKR
ncbi:polysaccharide biosynthesis protein [Brumimicrobium salinarum]|uniref:Polysaccharide biosynthesis protein n=1 Tax=Brumimicrobium salinarum TaxID=2058658 RepID=A0A2I0R6J0_9FLAO|nr:oligosaccharide flippase family protein [Brumimicrobium salinarum]PKR82187.1 polysaccharide biosynthesis protein [Brumimicrobium salinarum]